MKETLASVLLGIVTLATITGIMQIAFLGVSIVGVIVSTYFTIKKNNNNKKTEKDEQ